MITKFNTILFTLVMTVVCVNSIHSQDTDEKIDKSNYKKFAFLNLRGPSAIDLVAGSALLEGDYEDTEYEVYFRIGYKYHLTSHLGVSLSYSKYNLAIEELYNEGYMSFDLNWEFLLSPYTRFTPFLYGGIGYNASNYFETTTTKAQGGAGIEIIITERVGLKLFGEYNYAFSDEENGLIEPEIDDTFIRMGLGLNFYFGGNKKKEVLRKKLKTVINSNPIVPKTKTQLLLLPNQS
jgi:curli production assembly/transport component CsgG